MSSLIANIEQVDKIERLEDTQKLYSVMVKGWCIISSGIESPMAVYPPVIMPRYKVGDKLVYLPPDVVMSSKLLDYLFPPDSKIDRPKDGRLKAIKIRGYLSYGMSIDITPELEALYPGISKLEVGDSVVDLLELKKWEPSDTPGSMDGDQAGFNPLFKKYTDIENIKNYKNVFIDGEEVNVTIKMHGSNFRASLLPVANPSLISRIKSFFTKKPLTEFLVGSRNKNLKVRDNANDIYNRIAKQYSIADRLKIGETIYGEVLNCQKDFKYGCNPGELKLVLFDVMIEGRYLDADEFKSWCDERKFDSCLTVYRGPFDMLKMQELAAGKGTTAEFGIPCREGVVIKPVKERYDHKCGRVILKLINPAYDMLKNKTEFQ